MTAECKKTGDWEEASRWFTTLAERSKQEIGKAITKNAYYLVKEIKERIRRRQYAPNSALTEALKGSSTPLVNQGDLIRSIQVHLIDSFSAFIGVKRGTRSADGDLLNIATILHEGITIEMTDKMRRWIFAQMRDAGIEPGETPGRDSGMKGYIKIPARPFIRDVFDDKKVRSAVDANWEKALEEIIKG